MHVRITGDTTSESGVGSIIDVISGPTRKHFVPKDYGDGLVGLVVVLMCQNSSLGLKRRIRLSKKDKTLYMDIILNHGDMVSVTPDIRLHLIATVIKEEVAKILSKYKIQQFEQQQFLSDIIFWMDKVAEQTCVGDGEGHAAPNT